MTKLTQKERTAIEKEALNDQGKQQRDLKISMIRTGMPVFIRTLAIICFMLFSLGMIRITWEHFSMWTLLKENIPLFFLNLFIFIGIPGRSAFAIAKALGRPIPSCIEDYKSYRYEYRNITKDMIISSVRECFDMLDEFIDLAEQARVMHPDITSMLAFTMMETGAQSCLKMLRAGDHALCRQMMKDHLSFMRGVENEYASWKAEQERQKRREEDQRKRSQRNRSGSRSNTSVYFTNCRTMKDLKKEYRRLMKLYHTDNHGNADICKEINIEYDKLKRSFGVA